jgi:hypothetical protein
LSAFWTQVGNRTDAARRTNNATAMDRPLPPTHRLA